MIKIKLYEMRTKKNMSTQKLSKHSGISTTGINSIENYRSSLTLFTLECLAGALDCKITDLFEEVKDK